MVSFTFVPKDQQNLVSLLIHRHLKESLKWRYSQRKIMPLLVHPNNQPNKWLKLWRQMCPLFVKLSYLLLYPGQLVKTKLSSDQKAETIDKSPINSTTINVIMSLKIKVIKNKNICLTLARVVWSCLPSGLKTLYNNLGSCNCLVCFK